MNLKELHSFKLSDAVKFHDKLNPKLFHGQHLDSIVKKKLLVIAEDFLSELGISDLKVKDITVSGSNAAYSYTPHSDLDLHILVDMNELDNNEVYKELFTAKKNIYNDTHDIKVKDIPVELYIQDSNLPVVSLGEYSLLQNKWLRLPTKRRANLDQTATKSKYEKLKSLADRALQSRSLPKIKKAIDKIKKYRLAGLDKAGEFSPENLAYKMLRTQGYIQKLFDLRDKLHSEKLSFETMYQNPLKQDVTENFNQPYPIKWEKSEVGDFQAALATLDDGSPLSIMFNDVGNDQWLVEFYRNNSQGITGKGDSQRVFATVLNAISKFIKKNKPSTLFFGSVRKEDPKGSRKKLYDRLVQKYANQLGYDVNKVEHPETTDFNLIRKDQSVTEASGYIPKLLYHVTPTKNIKSIAKEGLKPGIGDRSNKIMREKSGIYVFPSRMAAEDAVMNWLGDEFEDEPLTMLKIDTSGLEDHISKGAGYEFIIDTIIEPNRIKKVNISLEEASGYIPSYAQRNDPRYKTALTVDVHPDTMRKNAKRFGNKISRAGIPPTARPDGKF